MRLKSDLRNLTENQSTTILTTSVSAGATTLIVANNSGFANNDFLLIGKLGEERTEIKRITAAVVSGTSLTIAALTFAHDEDTPITKIDFNQVRFFHGTTNVAASSVALGAAPQDLDPTSIYNFFNDTTNTTGFGFIRFFNSFTLSFSDFSDAIPYTGYTDKMLRKIRQKVRRLINETDELNSYVSNDEIDEEINLSQKEIAHDRLWTFYEKTKSFSSVANQFEYSLATDVFVLYDAAFETQPLAPITINRWNTLRWDTDATGDPTHIGIWRRRARVYPYPSKNADTTILTADLTATAVVIPVASTSAFQSQGRIRIGSEVISYTGKTLTSFTGCVRGEEETTPASHLIGATVTERDFIYHFQEEPRDLFFETDETLISEPSVIAYKAGAELTIGVEGKETLHDRLLLKYERGMVQLRKVHEPKIKSSFGRVKDMGQVVSDMGIRRDFPPSNIG